MLKKLCLPHHIHQSGNKMGTGTVCRWTVGSVLEVSKLKHRSPRSLAYPATSYTSFHDQYKLDTADAQSKLKLIYGASPGL